MKKRTITFTPEMPYGARTEKLTPITCDIEFHQDNKGRWGITLLKDGMPYGEASVEMPQAQLPPGWVCIKDYSENAGVLAGLIKAGIVIDTGGRIPSGWVEIPICKFTDEIKNELNIQELTPPINIFYEN